MPIATEVTVKTPDDIAFVDAGVNQGSARCRACGEELDDGWWAAAMGESYERSAFADRRVVLPCCGTVADLNELDYGDWPVAFARWWVDCLNPGVGRLSEAQVQTLATAIGQPVTVVYRHI